MIAHGVHVGRGQRRRSTSGHVGEHLPGRLARRRSSSLSAVAKTSDGSGSMPALDQRLDVAGVALLDVVLVHHADERDLAMPVGDQVLDGLTNANACCPACTVGHTARRPIVLADQSRPACRTAFDRVEVRRESHRRVTTMQPSTCAQAAAWNAEKLSGRSEYTGRLARTSGWRRAAASLGGCARDTPDDRRRNRSR